MDTNMVVPTGPGSCTVVYDYYLDTAEIQRLGDQVGEGGHTAQWAQCTMCPQVEAVVDKSLAASDQVQQEDSDICDSVQRGLASAGYGVGRWG